LLSMRVGETLEFRVLANDIPDGVATDEIEEDRGVLRLLNAQKLEDVFKDGSIIILTREGGDTLKTEIPEMTEVEFKCSVYFHKTREMIYDHIRESHVTVLGDTKMLVGLEIVLQRLRPQSLSTVIISEKWAQGPLNPVTGNPLLNGAKIIIELQVLDCVYPPTTWKTD